MQSEMTPTPSIEQLRWQCRRSMLELDLLFERFVLEGHYAKLSDEQKELFGQLLEKDDPTLLEWATGKEEPEDEKIGELITLIREAQPLHKE
jgi:antitoxin CptB